MSTPCILDKRRQAQALRAAKKAVVDAKKAVLAHAKTDKDKDRAATKAQKVVDLKQEKLLREQTKQAREANRKADKDKIKSKKKALTADKQALRDRRERNKRLRDITDAKRAEVQALLNPTETAAIRGLVETANQGEGQQKDVAIRALGEKMATIRGLQLTPGADPYQIMWQANVLFSLSTNVANISGNASAYFTQIARDIGRGDFRKARRFSRAVWGALLSKQTLRDIKSGMSGEISARRNDDQIDSEVDIRDLATGIITLKENDPKRILEAKFGTGKLGVFRSSTAYSLRALGAMDAVFSRASREGRFAREEPTYKEYLDNKLQAHTTNRIVATLEAKELAKYGAKVPRDYVNRRTDELTILQKPKDVRERVLKNSRKDVFQAEKGPTGAVATVFGQALNKLGNVDIGGKKKTFVNAEPINMLARAIGNSNRVARDSATLDEVYPVVMRGLAEGRTLEINGQPVKGNTAQLLGEIVEALAAKQLINLKGGSKKPFKYIVGMFVNTASQIIDLSMETIPLVGAFDKRIGGSWDEFTPDDKTQLMGLQITSAALTSGIFLAAFAGMGEEDAFFRINGAMRDNTLRAFYKGRKIPPYSFQIGGEYFIYKDIPGLNLIFGGIGELSDQYMIAKRTPDRPITFTSALQSVGLGIAYSATQLSMLKNLQVMADLVGVQEDSWTTSLADITTNVVGGHVPYAGAARELERFIFGDLSKSQDLATRMIQNIPMTKFFSKTRPMLNLFGEPVNTTILPGIDRFLGFSKPSPELSWLLNSGYKISLPKPNAVLSEKQAAQYKELLDSDDAETFESVMTEDHQYEYLKKLGPELKLEINELMKAYPTGYSKEVQDILNARVSKIKKIVKNEIISQ